jgi:hypothetical protein
MDFRARPNNDYLLNAKWQELYILTEHWQSDVEFFKDELTFLQTLFDKYFQYLSAEENIQETKVIAAMLEGIKTEQAALSAQVSRHLIHISELIKNPFVQNEPLFRAEHIELENRFVEFVKRFKEIKRKLFQIAERASKIEKKKHQLAP